MSRIDQMYWKVLNRLNQSINESIEYSLPQIPILGVVGLAGFPLFYWIWHVVFPQPYDNIGLNIIGCVCSALLIFWYRSSNNLTFRGKLFWILVFTYELSFFFTFMLLMNSCNMVWTMSTMSGLMLLVLIAHDWLLATLMHIVGSVAAFFLYTLMTSTPVALELYAIQIPIYLFVVIAGGLFNYQSSTIQQARLKALASVGAELAHELRTPLLAIDYHNKKLDLAANRLPINWQLTDKSTQTAILDSIKITQTEIKHANTIIDMFLLDLGSKNIYEDKFAQFSARAVLKMAIERYPFASELEKRKVSFTVDGDFNFYGSDILLMHVLFNLIKNALAHLGQDGQLQIKIVSGRTSNRIEVLDSGQGIAPSSMAYIFDEFYTLGAHSGGTGIGLAFCKKVMRHFKGHIECESELGQYTLFRLLFPSVLPLTDQKARKEQLGQYLVRLRGKKLLAIEAQQSNVLKKLHNTLAADAVQVTWVQELTVAFLNLRSSHYDAIVVNPGVDEASFLDGIRLIRGGSYFKPDQCPNYKSMPIIVVSENHNERLAKAFVGAGASAFLADLEINNSDAYVTTLSECFESKSSLPAQQKWRHLSGKAVLVVDDHEINCLHIRAQLEPFDVITHYAADGEVALKMLETHDYDCIFMDLHMPEMSGWDVTEQIRSGHVFSDYENYSSIPIVGLSGDPRPELLARCLQSGFNKLMIKPVDQAMLLDTLVEQINAPDTIAAENRIKLDGLDSKSLEPEANFLHDILTPLMLIENGNSLLKEALSTLMQESHLPSDKSVQHALSKASGEVENLTLIVRSSFTKFWQEVRSTANPRELTHLKENFVKETSIQWKRIEDTLSISTIRNLPEYLDDNQTAPFLEKLPAETLQALYTVNEKFDREINSGRTHINNYCNAVKIR